MTGSGCSTRRWIRCWRRSAAAEGSARGERDRRLRGVDEERQRFLQVQRNGVGVVAEVSDRDVGAQLQIEIPSASGQHERAVDCGRPNDVTVDQSVEVFEDWIAVIGGLA